MSGVAALLGVAALVVSAVPAAASSAGTPPPSPGELVPGQRTDTPALVDGIKEQAPAARNAAGAARAYLAAKRDRYRIADPDRDLQAIGTLTANGQETVRLRQKHHGVPVLGGEYVVRMREQDGRRVVTGTSGKYFTGLRVDTTPQVDDALAVERAVDAVRDQLGAERFTRPADDEAVLTGVSHGLVVLPNGTGVLTRHITVRGTDQARGEPVLREVYIDARAGYPVLQYSAVQTFGAPAAATRASAAHRLAKDVPAAGEPGSGVRLNGTSVDLSVTHDETRGAYLLRDGSRSLDGSGNVLTTWDARGKWVDDVSGVWPAGIKEFGSPAPAFGAEATESGAVDAHWAAGQVYDYYRSKFGRDSLDGHGMAINSLVGVTYYGFPYVNAFWDGQKMVYGTGDDEYRPLSAGLDVVGHEMTHGVVEHSAALVYAGQSGAMNEAIADYFGNAIETDAYGISVDDPDSGLLGETLCRTMAARECAIRDMNDGRTTAKSFLGVGFGTDNGGVHLNSTIFSGALWDVRQELGAELGDRVVYKALTEYLTPLDGFTQGRAAVIAAARALKVNGKQLTAVQRAFAAHGIVPNWELALGVDSDPLLERVNTYDTHLGVGGDWWVASNSDESGAEAYSVWAGHTDGKGSPKLMSPNDGRYHVNPATDGKTVVWQAQGPNGVDILARPLAGGPVRTLWHGTSLGTALDVDGDTVAFAYYNGGRPGVAYLSLKDPANVKTIGGGTSHRSTFPSVSDGKVVYQDTARVAAGYEYTTRVVDVATGEDKVIQRADPGASLGPTAVAGGRAYWLLDGDWTNGATTLRGAALDGSDVRDISPETGPQALNIADLTASGKAVTVVAATPDLSATGNESLSKLWQFTPEPKGDGMLRQRVSCNRGEQLAAAAAPGNRVVWLDATTGTTDVVTRARPAGRCD
ncbi:M4 family metallopeptidase [Streptomyces sp. NPDC086787]|uniref:M4 family metallopeptidase n=1 Tax=Streptomyces sp. NPDC086787 TaxID=3365759 RepID=UPI0038257087